MLSYGVASDRHTTSDAMLLLLRRRLCLCYGDLSNMKPAKYLALDPGHSTGWASFTGETGDLQEIGTCKSRQEVYELLESVMPITIIMEDWVTHAGVRLGGDNMETVRVIGAVEYWAWRNKSAVHLQRNTIKPIGYKWAGIAKPKVKSQEHQADAYVHGVYFLQSRGIRRIQQAKRD